MIKAEDLRIGDLVKINENCSLKEGVISYITEIRTRGIFVKEDYVKVKHFDSDWEFGVWCCNIDPIPLTPEILEKNGWKRDKLVTYIYGHEAHNIEVICTPNSERVDVTFKGDTLHRIKYVHELQHILWALGLDANLTI